MYYDEDRSRRIFLPLSNKIAFYKCIRHSQGSSSLKKKDNANFSHCKIIYFNEKNVFVIRAERMVEGNFEGIYSNFQIKKTNRLKKQAFESFQ